MSPQGSYGRGVVVGPCTVLAVCHGERAKFVELFVGANGLIVDATIVHSQFCSDLDRYEVRHMMKVADSL